MVKAVRTQPPFTTVGPGSIPGWGTLRSSGQAVQQKIIIITWRAFINANVPALIPEMMAELIWGAVQTAFKGSSGECQRLSGMK